MNEYFKSRRSVRKFTGDRIDVEKIKSMLEAAFHAPTTGNMQLYSVVITHVPDKIAALAPAHFNQPASTGCDAMLTFCADFNRFERWCEMNDAVPGYGNLQGFMMGVLDATIVAQQFVTIAEMNGFGTCYLGTTTYNAQMIADALNLPEKVVPVVTIAVGVPAEMPEDSGRLPLSALVFDEQYSVASDEDIAQAYAEKEAREDSVRFVAGNGKKNLAQVFTDVRYTKADCERFSQIYADFIKKSGFEI